MDSGASETVLPEDALLSIELREGAAARRGTQYEVATGTLIPNLGEKTFNGVSTEEVTRRMTAQVCDVNKPLLSVRRMVAAGNRVVFYNEGSYIEDKETAERMWLTEEDGMYMLSLWVHKQQAQPF